MTRDYYLSGFVARHSLISPDVSKTHRAVIMEVFQFMITARSHPILNLVGVIRITQRIQFPTIWVYGVRNSCRFD